MARCFVVILGCYRRHFSIQEDVWNAFCGAAGDPGDDLRPLGSLPCKTFTSAITLVRPEGRRLTLMQASQLGMMFRAAKRYLHILGGGTAESWVDFDPWNLEEIREEMKTSPPSTSCSERKVKFGQILDQNDEGEFLCDSEAMRGTWYANYISAVGGMPQEEEDPSLEQLSGLSKRLQMGMAPFTDFAVWGPYQRRVGKNTKYKTFILQEDGSFLAKMVAGPSSFSQLLACLRVMRTAFIMLKVVSLSSLMRWEAMMEKLHQRYPQCWHLLVEGENKARADHLQRTLTLIKLRMDQGEAPPLGWNPKDPWETVWVKVMEDAEFWQTQIHVPALSWLAKGSRGVMLTPAEEVAAASLKGGVASLRGGEDQLQDVESPVKNVNKQRREARKRKAAAEKEELRKSRAKGGGKRSRQRRKGVRWGRRVLCLEQRQWCLRRAGSGRSMQRKESAPSPLYGVQESRAPFQRMPSEEGWLNFLMLLMKGTKVHPVGEGEEAASSSGSRVDKAKGNASSRGTKVNKFLSEEDEVVDGDRVQIGRKMMEESDYFKVRVFTFVHHFAGERDPLSCAMKEEAEKRGIRLRVVAVEKAHGADLLEPEPFNNHREKAASGDIDGFHSGWPCDTFSRLRWRKSPGLPPPLRSKDHPYGLPGLTASQQKQADDGTILMCRSLEMGKAMERRDTWGIESQVSILLKTLPAVKFHNTSQLGTCRKPRSL